MLSFSHHLSLSPFFCYKKELGHPKTFFPILTYQLLYTQPKSLPFHKGFFVVFHTFAFFVHILHAKKLETYFHAKQTFSISSPP